MIGCTTLGQFSARLYESTGSYYCHSDLDPGIGFGVGLDVGVYTLKNCISKHFK